MSMETLKIKGILFPLVLGLVLGFGCGKQTDGNGMLAKTPAAAAGIESGSNELVSEETVGLPVYPGLKKVSASDGGEMTIGEVTVNALPSVVGISEDPFDQVVAFYSEHLEDWNRFDFHGTQFFWKGDPDEEYNPLNMKRHVTIPSVSVMPPVGKADTTVRVEYIYER